MTDNKKNKDIEKLEQEAEALIARLGGREGIEQRLHRRFAPVEKPYPAEQYARLSEPQRQQVDDAQNALISAMAYPLDIARRKKSPLKSLQMQDWMDTFLIDKPLTAIKALADAYLAAQIAENEEIAKNMAKKYTQNLAVYYLNAAEKAEGLRP